MKLHVRLLRKCFTLTDASNVLFAGQVGSQTNLAPRRRSKVRQLSGEFCRLVDLTNWIFGGFNIYQIPFRIQGCGDKMIRTIRGDACKVYLSFRERYGEGEWASMSDESDGPTPSCLCDLKYLEEYAFCLAVTKN